ncbi:unnamed protein product, partial [Prorocentrum cordatum]
CSRGGLSLPQHDGSRHELQILEWSVHRLARDVAAPIYAAAGFHDAVLRRCLRARGAALQSGERSGVPEEGAVAEAEGAWHAEHGRRDGERGGDVRMERGGDRRSQERLALLLPSGRLAQPRPPGRWARPAWPPAPLGVPKEAAFTCRLGRGGGSAGRLSPRAGSHPESSFDGLGARRGPPEAEGGASPPCVLFKTGISMFFFVIRISQVHVLARLWLVVE